MILLVSWYRNSSFSYRKQKASARKPAANRALPTQTAAAMDNVALISCFANRELMAIQIKSCQRLGSPTYQARGPVSWVARTAGQLPIQEGSDTVVLHHKQCVYRRQTRLYIHPVITCQQSHWLESLSTDHPPLQFTTHQLWSIPLDLNLWHTRSRQSRWVCPS